MAAPGARLLSSVAGAALAASLLFMAVDGQVSGLMTITNTLPYPIRILCSSGVEKKPLQTLIPGGSYFFTFNFDVQKQSSWTCSFQSEERDGTFMLWEHPNHAGLCSNICSWTVGLDGLSVQRDDGKQVPVYFWY